MFSNLVKAAMLSSNTLASKAGTFVHKNADKILLGTGIALICGGTVSAVVKSKDIAKVVDDHKKAIAKANKIEDEKLRGKKKLEVYKDTAIQTMLTFGPCVLLTGTGIACIMGSHYILTQRLASCQAAYAMLDTSFREYRERVKEKIGEEKELDIYNNKQEIEFFEDNGDGKGVKKTKIVEEKGAHGPYDFLFQPMPQDGSAHKGFFNRNATGNPERDREWLYSMQWWTQDRVNRHGEASMADVLYEMDQYEDKRDIPSYLFDVIWRRGDVVSFGIENDSEFMLGKKNKIWLHFNPSGFRRKLRKEEMAYLKAARETVNEQLGA